MCGTDSYGMLAVCCCKTWCFSISCDPLSCCTMQYGGQKNDTFKYSRRLEIVDRLYFQLYLDLLKNSDFRTLSVEVNTVVNCCCTQWKSIKSRNSRLLLSRFDFPPSCLWTEKKTQPHVYQRYSFLVFQTQQEQFVAHLLMVSWLISDLHQFIYSICIFHWNEPTYVVFCITTSTRMCL